MVGEHKQTLDAGYGTSTTTDLPSSVAAAAEIDMMSVSDKVVGVFTTIAVDFQFLWAVSAAAAATAFAAGAYHKQTAGSLNFGGWAHRKNLYVRSQGAASTNGLSYTYVEGA